MVQNWEKIRIIDAYGGLSKSFNQELEINRSDYLLYNSFFPEFEIKKIDSTLIQELLSFLEFEKLKKSNSIIIKEGKLRTDPLLMFGRDSLWLANNAQRIWDDYLGDQDKSPEIDSLAISIISDYTKIKPIIWSLPSRSWTDDYPIVSVEVINDTDTLFFQSTAQMPYMLPWIVNGITVYDNRISEIIAQFLPKSVNSNKSRLEGKFFEYKLVDYIHKYFVEEEIEKIEVVQKYPKLFNKIQKYFLVESADLTYMMSIEWVGNFGKKCLELMLKDKKNLSNIDFSLILGRRLFLHSPRAFLRKKEEIIQQLENNPVYQYTVKCSDCTGEIHFVNNKSLSREARREFLRDCKSNDIPKNTFRGRLRKTIFYEFKERKGEKSCFTRWIFLKDGTLVLWQMKGDFVMNLPKEIIENNKGDYICRIIPKEYF